MRILTELVAPAMSAKMENARAGLLGQTWRSWVMEEE